MAVEKPQKVELLWWSGCPSWPEALEQLRQVTRELGLPVGAIEVREVNTEEEADRERFVGSPTIRVDGQDIQPPGPDEPLGLTCRIYRLRDGRVSPLPDTADLRDALARAAGEASIAERSKA
jgi:hypothetical protein